MTQFLPPNLLALFAPRDPIQYLPPLDKLPFEKKTSGYTGVGAYLHQFEDPKDTPPPTRVETREERLERKRREKAEQAAYKLEQDIALWDPLSNPKCTSDPYKTLFVARVNYDTSESKLRREFEVYGPIKKIHLVHDIKTGKPRGYAFIEYEHERDMHSAYKHADGKKIDSRRVLVDVERARTVKGWLPRRLGGGLGGTRRGGPDVNIKHSGREEMRGGGEERERPERGEREGRGERPEREGRGERERERRRSRSKSRERRRRSTSRGREHRRERRKRSRERSRDRDKERGRDKDALDDKLEDGPEIEEKRERKRSRSRERTDRKRGRRSRSRSRERDRKRRDRDRDRRDKGDHDERQAKVVPEIHIKQEEEDDSYLNGAQNVCEYSENSADAYGTYVGSQYGDYTNPDNENSEYFNSYNGSNYTAQEPYEIEQE